MEGESERVGNIATLVKALGAFIFHENFAAQTLYRSRAGFFDPSDFPGASPAGIKLVFNLFTTTACPHSRDIVVRGKTGSNEKMRAHILRFGNKQLQDLTAKDAKGAEETK